MEYYVNSAHRSGVVFIFSVICNASSPPSITFIPWKHPSYSVSIFIPPHTPRCSIPTPSFPPRSKSSLARTSSVDIELPQRSSEIIDVPYTKGNFFMFLSSFSNVQFHLILFDIRTPLQRNACARERWAPLIPQNATAGSSRPPNSAVTQQSSGAAQTQSSPPHATDSTSTPPHHRQYSYPRATIRYASRWTRFWLFICCTSAEYTDGHY
ncbi:hypothetical protein BDR04DRAFT_1148394 [Suillus decipiens]|nr:hypothetical protein BDR04DRAFT_1148394 [Suillus decipiens]